MELRRQLRVRSVILLATALQILAAVLGVSILLAPGTANAVQTVPYLVNFQGRLTDNNGNVLSDGSYNIKFRIFNASTGGTNEWEGDRIYGTSDHRVTVTNGLFNIQFGDTSQGDPALSPSLFNTQTYPNLYLEVELPTPATATCASNGCATWTEGAMTPRQPLASSPYAFNSDELDGLDSSAFGQLTATQSWTSTNTFSASGAAAVVLSGSAASGGSILQIGSALSGGNGAGTLFGANTTSSGDLLNLQVSNTTELKVDNSGNITDAGNFQYTSGANHTLIVAQAASGTGNDLSVVAGQSGSGLNNGGNLFLEAGATGGTGTAGKVVVKANGVDSATAFQVQNAGGVAVLTANTINSSLAVNTTTADATLTIKSDALHTVTIAYAANGTTSLPLPPDVTAVTVKAWGAGGGGGAGSAGTALGGSGGGGGFAQATVSATGGSTLSVDVGSGGPKAGTNEFGGAGGGYSGVRNGSTYLIQAGGGGGGGGALNNTNSAGSGGAGGGASGVAGGNGAGTGPGLGGQPGTPAAGGAGGTGGSGSGAAGIDNAGGDAAGSGGTCATNSGNTGYGGTGGGGIAGSAATCENGGGGGGGNFGGGGGGSANGNNRGGGGGGGGSDLVTGSGPIELQGSGTAPANNLDSDYLASCAANAGKGGTGTASTAANTAGNDGCVVVSYQTATNNTTTFDVQNSTGADTVKVLSNGDAAFQNTSDNTTAFQIQNATGNPVLTADTSDNKLVVGDANGTNPTLLVIDSATSDPSSGYNGAEYYNTSTATFRCYQANAWTDCITPPDSVTATSNTEATYMAARANMTASQTGLALNTFGVTSATAFAVNTAGDDATTFTAPANGSFRSCVVMSDGVAVTGGTLSLRWRDNGVSVGAAACTLSTSATLTATSAIDSGVTTFNAGDSIGVAFDSSSTFAPATADYTVYYTVEYDSSSGNGLTEQFVYDNSSSPATINLSDGKDFVINAADTTTDPNDIVNLQCTTSCGSNGRFAVQNGGVDAFVVSPNNGGIALNQNTTLGSGKNLTVTSGAISQTFSSGAAANAQTLAFSNTNTTGTVAVQGINISPANSSAGTNTLNLINFAAGSGGTGTDTTNGINFASSTGYTNYISTPTTDLDSSGDLTSSFTQLTGTSTTNGTGTNSTSLVLNSATNFVIGNYVQVNSANCGGSGINPCYAKITNIVSNTLTITPALTWTNASTVNQYHLPEIGGIDTSQTLANRYGRGYFIAGVATGNGTTFYDEDGITSSLSTYNLLSSSTDAVSTIYIGNTSTANLNLGGVGTTVAIPGALTVDGQSIVNGSGQINGAQLQSGSVANTTLANSSLTVATTGNLSGGGSVSLGGTITVNTIANPTFSTSVTTPSLDDASGLTVGATATSFNLGKSGVTAAFAGSLSVGSFAAATSTPVCSNGGTLSTCNALPSSTTLNQAYTNGNTISTSGNDIGFTLNSGNNFTVATAAGGTGFTTFSLTDGSNATPPAQLVLVENKDVNQPLATGISVQSAAGTITTAVDASGSNITNALAIGANAITGTHFGVTGAGAVTAVGVNAGTGSISGTGGIAITGASTIAGTLGSVTSLTLSGAISGGTTYSGSSTINTTGGTIQTNSTDRITNTGNLTNIGAISASNSATSGTNTTLATTNSGATGTNSITGVGINISGTNTSGTNNTTGLNFGNVTNPGGTNNYYAENFGTGFTNLLTYNGASTVIINGSGQVNGAQIQSATIANGSLANSGVTVATTGNLTGGGLVALGGTITLNTTASPSFTTSVTTPILDNAGSLSVGASATTFTLGKSGVTATFNGAISSGTNSITGGTVTGTSLATSSNGTINSGSGTITSSGIITAGTLEIGAANINTGGGTPTLSDVDYLDSAQNISATKSFTKTTGAGAVFNGSAASTGMQLQFGTVATLSGGSTNGTYIGADPATYTGDFLNLQINNAVKFKVDNTGNVTAGGGLTIASGSVVTVGAAAGVGSTVSCSANQAVTAAVFTGGVLTTAPTCSAITGTGANTTLSNLGATAIDADLLPDTTLTRSLGSGTDIWKNLFVSNIDTQTTTNTALTVGTSNATSIQIGKSGVAVSMPGGLTTTGGTINTGAGSITSTGTVGAGTIQTGATTRIDGSGNLSNIGTIASSTSAATGTSVTHAATNSGATGTNTITDEAINLSGTNTTGTNNTTGLNFGNVTNPGGTNNFYAENFGTGFTNLLTYNGAGTVIINGSGQVNGGQLVAGSVANGALASSTVGVTAGTGLTGGSGSISLGGTTSLSVDPTANLSWTGAEQFNKSGGVGAQFNGTAASGGAQLLFGGVTGLNGGSANGTYLGANPATYTGDYINFAINSVNKFKVDNSGNVTAAGTITGTTFSGSGASLTNLNPTNLVQGSGAVTLQSATATGVTITSNAAATWSTSGVTQLTVQSGSGQLSLGTTTSVAANGALTVESTGTNALTLATQGAANIALSPNTTGIVTVGGNTPTLSGNTTLTLQSASGNNINITPGTTGTVVVGGTTPTITTASGTPALKVDTGAAATLSLGTTNANNVTIGNATSTTTTNLIGGTAANAINFAPATNGGILGATTGTGIIEFDSGAGIVEQSTTNNTQAFQIQNSGGVSMLNIDTSTGAAANLLSDSGFEKNPTTNWTNLATGSFTRVTTQAYNDFASAEETTGTTAGNGIEEVIGTILATNTTYTFSFYAKADSSTPNITDLQAGYSSAGTTGGEANCTLNSTTVITAGWMRYICTFTTSGTAPVAGAFMYIDHSGGTNDVFYIDAAQLETGSFASPYGQGQLNLNSTIDSPVNFQETANSTTAFQITNTIGTNILDVDTFDNNQNNQATNPSFETGTTGWAASSANCTFSQDNTTAYNGSSSGKCVNAAVANTGMNMTGISPVMVSGTTYTLALYVKSSANMSTLEIGHADNGTTYTSCLTAQSVTSLGWKRLTCTFTAGAQSGTPFVYVRQTDAVARTIWVDAVTLETDANASTNYRDGRISLGNATISSPVVFQTLTNSSTALQVQNAAGIQVFDIDTASDPNLVTNSGFEVNSVGWSIKGTATGLIRDTSKSYVGIASGKVTTVTTGDGMRYTFGTALPAVAATSYTISGYVESSVADAGFTMGYNNGADTACTDAPASSATVPSAAGWTRFICSTPVNTTVNSIFFETSTAVATTLNVDGVQVVLGATAPAFGNSNISFNGVFTSPIAIRNPNNTTTEFQVQDASSNTLFGIDSLNDIVSVGSTGTATLASTVNLATSTGSTQTVNIGSATAGSAAAGTTVSVQGGTGTGAVVIGTNGAGQITIDTGTTGQINIGTGTTGNPSKTIQIGPSATSTGTVSYNIGTNLAAGGTQDINLGSTGSNNAAANTTVSIQGGTGTSAIVLGTNGAGAIAIDSGTTGAINIGSTNANAKTTTVGNTNTTSATYIQGGTGGTIGLGSVVANNPTLSSTVNIANTTNATGTQAVGIGSNANAANSVVIDAGNTGKLQIGNSTAAHTIQIGAGGTAAGGNVESVTIGSPTTTTNSKVLLQGGNIAASSGASGVEVGNPAADANMVPFQLDSDSNFSSDESNGTNCTTTINQGAMYYNTTTNAIRACVNANWEDVVTTSGLGILLFGIVPDSGADPGDLASVTDTTNHTTGPCKVSIGTTTSNVAWTACTAYSGGRKINVTAGNVATIAGTSAANVWEHLCLTGTSDQPALSAVGAETADFTGALAFSITSPVLCLADVKVTNGSAVITDLYDTRTFTTTQKTFATAITTAPVLSSLVATTVGAATPGSVTATTAANQALVQGVVVATSGATSTTTVNVVVASSGPALVKAITATGNNIGDYVNGTTTAGYAEAVTAAPTTGFYTLLGMARTAWLGAGTCTASKDLCEGSVLVNVAPR